MKFAWAFAWATVILAAFAVTALPATIIVPDDISQIQDAVTASAAGDTILVRPGVYKGPGNRGIDFQGKVIALVSECGPEETIIDCEGQAMGVIMIRDETEETRLEGFTIQNGAGRYCGGIWLGGSSPTIARCIIRGCTSTWHGGGINCDSASPTITDCIILGNQAPYKGGGGLYCQFRSAPVIENSIFRSNQGGAIYCVKSNSITITDSVVENNHDGGIVLFNTQAAISGCTITGNEFVNGGGIFVSDSDSTITNCIIANNRVNGLGGGVYVAYNACTITNCTITGNFGGLGGGISATCSAAPIVTNTILWNNKSNDADEIYVGDFLSSSTCTISYSVIGGGIDSVVVKPGCRIYWGDGLIDADPVFVDPAAADYHIPFVSPCRSAGSRSAPALPDCDFEGDPRLGMSLCPDIGADEFHTRLYVNGKIAQGETATGIIVGWPLTSPVVLITGTGVRPEPLITPYGVLWMLPPWQYRGHLNPIPDTGIRRIPWMISSMLPPGTEIPVQALVGTYLTNLWILRFE